MADKAVHRCDLDGRAVVVYERSASIPNPALGMIPTSQVVETWYACEAPEDWPKVRIRARRGFAWAAVRLGRRSGLELDDERFNRAFRVDAIDDDFAIVLLSPEMQQFLLEKRSVDWSLGEGYLKLFYRGSLKKSRIERSLDRLRRFWSHVPDELWAWDDDEELKRGGPRRAAEGG